MACDPIEPVENVLLCVIFFKELVYIDVLIRKNEYKENKVCHAMTAL